MIASNLIAHYRVDDVAEFPRHRHHRDPVCSKSIADLERNVIDLGHEGMTEALALSLEALDARLMAQRPDGLACHDIRTRTLATEIGDVTFSIRRYRDRIGL